MSELPNAGVKFCLGYYKIELILHTGYGRSRRLVVESDDTVVGLFSDELIDQVQVDVEILRKMANECVVVAKKERDKEDEFPKS